MGPSLDAIIHDQHGIFARWQAIGCAVAPREFDRLARRGGPWLRVRYGIYTTRQIWNTLSAEQRLILRDRAALLVCDADAVLSHSSAARLLGLPLYDVHDDLSHVIRRTPDQSGRTQAKLKHHLSALEDVHVTTEFGARVTVPERTTIDLAREYGFHTGIVAADAALHTGADPDLLASMARDLTTEPGRPTVSRVVAAADGGAETPIETLGRVLLVAMGIAELKLQFVVPFAGGGSAVGDIYSPDLNHLFECDGRIKYQGQYDRFGNLVAPDDVLWLEKKREDKIRGEGIGFSRLIWPDVQPDSFERTSARLWTEIEQQGARRSHWLPPPA